METPRELEEISKTVDSIRDDPKDFLNDPKNTTQRLNGLVEDIRYALVDYQVCTPK